MPLHFHTLTSRRRALNLLVMQLLPREGTFFILGWGGGGGVGPWLRREGSFVNFLQIGEVKPVLFSTGPSEGHRFFGKEKITPCMSLLFCIYKQSCQSRLIEISYRCRKVYISKDYLLPINIIVSLDPCRFNPYFDVSARGSGIKSVSGEDSSLKLLGLEPTSPGTTLGLHLSTSLDLHFHLFPQPMCHQQSQWSIGHPF